MSLSTIVICPQCRGEYTDRGLLRHQKLKHGSKRLVVLKQWKDANEMRPSYTCCNDFDRVEKQELIVATDKGWAVLGEHDAVAFDVRFCPFCGVKLPEIKP